MTLSYYNMFLKSDYTTVNIDCEKHYVIIFTSSGILISRALY